MAAFFVDLKLLSKRNLGITIPHPHPSAKSAQPRKTIPTKLGVRTRRDRPITASWFWRAAPSSPPSPPPPLSPRTPQPRDEDAESSSVMTSRAYDAPTLTPQFCFNTTQLRDFLRLSRSTIDDSITQNMNSLLTPASASWDPSSVQARQIGVPPGGRRAIDGKRCDDFRARVLFPSWQSRSDVLSYCASVATSPDPDDPDQILRGVEDARQREKEVDERLDPYSARYFPREPRTEYLAEQIRRERAVEDIVRARTWAIVGERCAGQGENWQEAVERWRRSGADGKR